MDPLTDARSNYTLVAIWCAFWGAFGLLDYWADRHDASLSRAARHLFCTHHPAGRATFTVALGTGAIILHRHIVGSSRRT